MGWPSLYFIDVIGKWIEWEFYGNFQVAWLFSSKIKKSDGNMFQTLKRTDKIGNQIFGKKNHNLIPKNTDKTHLLTLFQKNTIIPNMLPNM